MNTKRNILLILILRHHVLCRT